MSDGATTGALPLAGRTTRLAEFVAPRSVVDALEYAGGVILLGVRTFRAAFKRPFGFDALVEQIEIIGLQSLSIATLTAVFSAMVMAVQFTVQMARFGAKEYVCIVVAISLIRELGPALTGLMVGGRVGAGIAAELGSMAVTEQIDAIRSMGADPVEKLVLPRMLAFILVMPLMTAFADLLGVTAAMVILRITTGTNLTYLFHATLAAVTLGDLMGGLIKTLFFGLWISLIACYQGLATTNGTEGVGSATTHTVVITSVVTLVGDFVLTNILMSFGL